MVNYNFELTWYNDEARQRILSGLDGLPAHSEARNLFLLLLQSASEKSRYFSSELLRVHLALAKNRLAKSSVLGLLRGLDREALILAEQMYDESVVTLERKPILDFSVDLIDVAGHPENWRVFASFFREGIFVVYIPAEQYNATLLDFLSQRDAVIRDLMRKRLPVLTPLAVMVADLQNSVKICSELPPEEYFELINEIWTTMGPIFRKYYGTYGKHVGDGMVYYFFPQPDSDYIFNALACAQELKSEVRKISKKWQLRKNWLNELYLNTGLHEGQEWLGTFQTATSVEFAVLGDTINHASRLSEFARFGTIWATKNLLSKLGAPKARHGRFWHNAQGSRRAGAFCRIVLLATGHDGRSEQRALREAARHRHAPDYRDPLGKVSRSAPAFRGKYAVMRYPRGRFQSQPQAAHAPDSALPGFPGVRSRAFARSRRSGDRAGRTHRSDRPQRHRQVEPAAAH